jgi:hypothetical protein
MRTRRKQKHIFFVTTKIWTLKYEILNEALLFKTVNNTKVDLLHKYNKYLKLLKF